MPVPRYKAFIEPLLRYLARFDSPVLAKEACAAAADELGLTESDRLEALPSGKFVYRDRAGWAFSWLKLADLAAGEGLWHLTAAGRELADTHRSIPPALFATLDARVEGKPDPRGSHAVRASVADKANGSMFGHRKAYSLPSEPFAEGGQAEVFLATRKADRKRFVFKRVKRSLSGDRMKREIEIQSTLVHANVMPIIDWDREEHRWFIMPVGNRVMSKLGRPLSNALICEIVRSILSALAVAHAAGHPHRDIKPENIIELSDGPEGSRWVLADWGLTRRPLGETTAKMTKSGHLLGTEGFAPPEAYTDPHSVGPPGDIYSIGQLLAWATGHDPIPNVSAKAPEPWTELVAQLTRQDVSARPQLVTDVERLLSDVCPTNGQVEPRR